jgi:hypothetical protein
MTEIDGVVFWIDSNIIHCTISKECEGAIFEDDVAKIFASGIATLSKGRYLPLLIDLREVGNFEAFRLFTILSPPSLLDFSVLSTSFLVRSNTLRILLSMYCIATGNAFWNTLYSNPKVALDHSFGSFKKGCPDNQQVLAYGRDDYS